MNGIDGVSFREVPGGLIVNVKKSQKSSTSGKLKKRLPYGFKQISRQISEAKTPDVSQVSAGLCWEKTRTQFFVNVKVHFLTSLILLTFRFSLSMKRAKMQRYSHFS